MKKPHEQEWDVSVNDAQRVIRADQRMHGIADTHSAGDARFIAAAPDMARALKGAVYEVVGSHLPILGPDANSDVIAARGLPVQMSAQTFAAMVAALRKAGVL